MRDSRHNILNIMIINIKMAVSLLDGNLSDLGDCYLLVSVPKHAVSISFLKLITVRGEQNRIETVKPNRIVKFRFGSVSFFQGFRLIRFFGLNRK